MILVNILKELCSYSLTIYVEISAKYYWNPYMILFALNIAVNVWSLIGIYGIHRLTYCRNLNINLVKIRIGTVLTRRNLHNILDTVLWKLYERAFINLRLKVWYRIFSWHSKGTSYDSVKNLPNISSAFEIFYQFLAQNQVWNLRVC